MLARLTFIRRESPTGYNPGGRRRELVVDPSQDQTDRSDPGSLRHPRRSVDRIGAPHISALTLGDGPGGRLPCRTGWPTDERALESRWQAEHLLAIRAEFNG